MGVYTYRKDHVMHRVISARALFSVSRWQERIINASLGWGGRHSTVDIYMNSVYYSKIEHIMNLLSWYSS